MASVSVSLPMLPPSDEPSRMFNDNKTTGELRNMLKHFIEIKEKIVTNAIAFDFVAYQENVQPVCHADRLM